MSTTGASTPLALIALALTACLAWASAAAAQTQSDLFNDAVVQDISLTVSQRDWDELRARADENVYYTADLRWNGVTVRNVGIRSRGLSTRNGIKPGLRVDFNRYLSDQLFVGLRALVLDNTYTDPSTMREMLSMKLFGRLGLAAPREAYARLFVNDEYVGLYVAVEPIDRTFIINTFGATEGNVEDGGYLYEYNWTRAYGFDYLGADLAAYAPMFEPKTHDTDAPARLYQPLEALARAINEVPADRFEAEVGALIDLPQFVTFLAIQQAVAEIDGFIGNWGMSNFSLYRFRDGRPARLIPWDADHAFWAVDTPVDDRLDTNVLSRRVMEIPALRRRYLDAIASAASAMTASTPGDDHGWLEREADRLEALATPAVEADPVSPFSFDEFRANTAGVRGLLRVRPPFLQCQAQAALDPEAPQSCPAPAPIEIDAPLPR